MRYKMAKVTKKQTQQRILAVIDEIVEHPERHDQAGWHSPCGTMHCFAGLADVQAGNVAPKGVKIGSAEWEDWAELTSVRATEWLGITEDEADELYDGSNRTDDLLYHCKEILESNGFKGQFPYVQTISKINAG